MKTRIPSFVLAISILTVLWTGRGSAQHVAGEYAYELIPAPGVEEPLAAAFHPDGTYAVVVSATNTIHAVDWASGTVSSYDLAPASGSFRFEDIAFSPDGSAAVIVGHHADAVSEGVVMRFDDAAYRDGGPGAEVVYECQAARRSEHFVGIVFPGGGGLPIVLGKGAANDFAFLREFDPAAEDFTALVAAKATAAGATDLAFVDNEFGGNGILVVCGVNGGASYFYTEVGGIWEWRDNPGNGTPGSLSAVAAHPDGSYALAVDAAGRRVYRFEAGVLNGYGDAPAFPARGIWNVSFQPDGSRALIVGRSGNAPVTGTVIEYRHDLYGLSDMTDVSIPGFDGPPYLASSSTYIEDAAFRPGCDGGLLVAREPGSPFFGLLVRFENTRGDSCNPLSAVPGAVAPGVELHGAVPNPFNPSTTIRFELLKAARVDLRIYDAAGRLVRTLCRNELLDVGPHEAAWNGRDDSGLTMASGMYFCRLETGTTTSTRSMTLVK